MPTEVELKLRVPPALFTRLARLPILAAGEARPARRFHAIYYDTPDRNLWKAGIALRVRREGTAWIQALKGEGSADAGLHQRMELEVPATGSKPDLTLFPPGPLTDRLFQAVGRQRLERVCTTQFARTVRTLRPTPDTVVEASLDRGHIRSARASELLCEIELELKSGKPEALYRIALELIDAIPLAVENRSKAERGYALQAKAEQRPVKASAMQLAAGMTARDAFRAIVRNGLAHLQANERGLLETGDPEYLHQARVALRRLRSAFSTFKDMLPASAWTALVEELRWLGRALGPARDWDVFVETTYRAVRAAFPAHSGLSALGRELGRRQRAARRRAQRAVASTRYHKLLLELGAWLQEELWHGDAGADVEHALNEPIVECASEVLEARHAKMRKRARKFDRRSLGELHALRIAAKKLRYAAQFFASLYETQHTEPLLDALARLQDDLGALNDAAGTPALMQSIATPNATPELAEARHVLTAWNLARVELLRRQARQAWKSAQRAATFW